MSGDPGIRRLLLQNPQMQSLSYAPTNFGQRENQKNYVFVDEHNRHKRLKVMRACEGCRKRKIKCDAATTNTWPCSACIRLKLHCVPPTVNYDRDFSNSSLGFPSEASGYENGIGEEEYHRQVALQQHIARVQKPNTTLYSQLPFGDPVVYHHTVSYGAPPTTQAQHGLNYSNMEPPINVLDGQYQQPQHSFPLPPLQHQSNHQQHPQTPENYQQTPYGEDDLADLLGGLKVNAAGTAPFLDHKQQSLEDEPVLEEVDDFKSILPPLSAGPDLKVRIPPELMPDEETAMHYLDMYFSNVHPYVPVLNKTMFYQQWHTNRESISPIILEAIFATAGRLADEPAQGQQWLALANKHLDSFADVPRLSTLQAMLIILKARESVPKRGYYYRSWMMVVQCVQIAKDLGLDEHYGEHKAGKPCGFDTAACINRTRIWQTLFVCELMIGSPQGRTDLAVGIESLDLGVPRPVPGDDDSEYQVTRNFTYFARVVRNVRRMNGIYARVKGDKQWGIDPEFVQLNPSFDAWISELPQDLRITFPSDGSSPWLPSHFIGNLHSYYYLSIIMLHRPQLAFMDPSGSDGSWKHHMLICYNSAKLLCRLQEGILQSFGLAGLLCMQRGINFTIYSILTCTVLHLVALTSPDPDLNTDARDYFTRHMRLLEKCTNMPDIHMQQQIDALREAFSADVRKPFVLKDSFPYGSPSSSASRSPLRAGQYRPQLQHTSSMEQQQSLEEHRHLAQHQSQVNYTSHPISPPVSVGSSLDNKSDSPASQSLAMMASGQRTQQPLPTTVPMVDPSTWNPNRIFDQWNTSFGRPSTSNSSAPPLRVITPTSGTHLEHILSPEIMPPASANQLPPAAQLMPPLPYSAAPLPSPSFVSPSMWQESVASVYEGGLKRQWDYDGHPPLNQASRRPR